MSLKYYEVEVCFVPSHNMKQIEIEAAFTYITEQMGGEIVSLQVKEGEAEE